MMVTNNSNIHINMDWWRLTDRLITELPCDHYDKDGRISVDNFLVVPNHLNVFAIGDCAYIIDPHT